MSKNKLNGISGSFRQENVEYLKKNNSDLLIREAFLRTSRETLDNFGIDTYSVEQIRGMLELLAMFKVVRSEVDEN